MLVRRSGLRGEGLPGEGFVQWVAAQSVGPPFSEVGMQWKKCCLEDEWVTICSYRCVGCTRSEAGEAVEPVKTVSALEGILSGAAGGSSRAAVVGVTPVRPAVLGVNAQPSAPSCGPSVMESIPAHQPLPGTSDTAGLDPGVMYAI